MNAIENIPIKMTGNERFNHIYINSRDKVYRTALYYTKIPAVAEEIMQDTLLELYINIDDVRVNEEENWLLQVAKHKSLNWQESITAEMKRAEKVHEMKDTGQVKSLEEDYLKQERNEDMGKLSKEIFTELRKENETWYKATVHVYCMGRPKKEVAKELNVSTEVLYAILYRARRWIKQKYGEQYREIFGI